jgi:hypothetical protein
VPEDFVDATWCSIFWSNGIAATILTVAPQAERNERMRPDIRGVRRVVELAIGWAAVLS